jgi:hypothetical protein
MRVCPHCLTELHACVYVFLYTVIACVYSGGTHPTVIHIYSDNLFTCREMPYCTCACFLWHMYETLRRVCVCFITAGPITKLFAWGEEESGGHVL